MSRKGRYKKFGPDFEPEPWYTDGSDNESEPMLNVSITVSSGANGGRQDVDDLDPGERDDVLPHPDDGAVNAQPSSPNPHPHRDGAVVDDHRDEGPGEGKINFR